MINLNNINNNDFATASVEIINKWYKNNGVNRYQLIILSDKMFNSIDDIDIGKYIRFNVDFLDHKICIRKDSINILGQLYRDYKNAPHYHNSNKKKDMDQHLQLERTKVNFIPAPLAKAVSEKTTSIDKSVIMSIYRKLPNMTLKSKIISETHWTR